MASEKILNQKKKEVEELAEKFKKAKLVKSIFKNNRYRIQSYKKQYNKKST